MGWKEEAERWKKAYWASLSDSEDERKAILEKQRNKRKKPAKKTVKKVKKAPAKKKTHTKKKKSIFKQLDLF